MLDKDGPSSEAHRLARIEVELQGIRAELTDIRTIISSGFDVLFKSNTGNADAIASVMTRLQQIEERLEPTFHQVFPRQREFLDELALALSKRRDH